jgi:predicted ATP-dependent Lon-type protease
MEGRRLVKEQLKNWPHTTTPRLAFSYVERDTGREVRIEAPEQPDELDADAAENAHLSWEDGTRQDAVDG